ncbi:MAG TPA: Hsp20/alpha crystallin family protein [Pyrinomonadaceae bacterium]|nr:Hsp20/alpha crystallin family protein [Pyrinomonadaceae bacterium]
MKNNKKERMELAPKTTEMANPFQMMRRFTQDMERFFEDFRGFNFPTFFRTDFAPFHMEFDKVGWMPQIEVFQNKDQFTVRADLPGLTKDDVKIEVTDDFLTISGERKEEKEEKHEGFYRSERNYGSFYRQIPLPESAKTENAEATFRNGVLEITIPAPKIAAPTRKLEIKEPVEAKPLKAAAAARS